MSLRAGYVGTQIQIQELSAERGTVRDVGGGTGANCEDFVGARPVEQELSLENFGVRISLGALADGGSRMVHPYPAANDEFRNRTQCVGEGGISAFRWRNLEIMVLADDIVRALLAFGRQLAVGEVVAGQTLAAGDFSSPESCGTAARKPTHVDLVGS